MHKHAVDFKMLVSTTPDIREWIAHINTEMADQFCGPTRYDLLGQQMNTLKSELVRRGDVN